MKFYTISIVILLPLVGQLVTGTPKIGYKCEKITLKNGSAVALAKILSEFNINVSDLRPFAQLFSVNVPVKYEIPFNGICYGALPCTKTRTETRMDRQLIKEYREQVVATCCDGYAEGPDQKCSPICLRQCANGKCVRPNVCQCSIEPSQTAPGFVGPTCSRFVCSNPNRWGSRCDLECNCPANAYCSASTGKCLCRAGWRGENCTQTCDSTMSCEEFELPPILEPEVNVIDDDLAKAQKLEALQLRALEGNLGRSNDSYARMLDANLLLVMLTITLVIALIWHRRRVAQLKDELYGTSPYSTGSGSSASSGSSAYSVPFSTGSHPAKRPRLPTPDEQYLGKNLSFAAATRSILRPNDEPIKDSARLEEETRSKMLLNPKIESSLLEGYRESEQNLYSDLESNTSSSRVRHVASDLIYRVPEETQALNSNMNFINDDGLYQVPRSQAPTRDPIEPSYVENNQDEQSSIYEEIPIRPTKPTPNGKQ